MGGETPNNVKLGVLKLTSGILEDIREGQRSDLSLINCLTLIDQGDGCDFRVDENGVMMLRDRVCVFYVSEFKRSYLEEGHISGLSIHLVAMNMYQYLKMMFWWPGMKKEVSEFVYACLTCHKSKIEYLKSLGLMQPLNIPTCKWDSISMDFVTGLLKSSKGCDSIWVIMDRLTCEVMAS